MNKIGSASGLVDLRADEELVEFVLAGQANVFARLYERYYSRAYRLAYGMMGQHEAAEDLTQEIFMRTFQKLGHYKRESSFSTWFYRLAVNCCLNYRRRERTEYSEMAPESDLHSLNALQPMEAKIFHQQIQAQIHRALLSLKPTLRMIVILKEIEGLSYQEIAERMNCSAGTVSSRLTRARQLLARKLQHLKGVV